MTQLKEVEFASRLTLKDLGADGQTVKALLKDLPEPQNKVTVARFYGTVTRVAFQNDKMGTGQVYTQFIGNFEGVNMITGEVVASARMYLPDGAQQALENQVTEVQNKKGKNTTVQFAFEIRAVRNSNKMGYSYETAAILKPEEADPIAAVRQVVANAPAPKTGGSKKDEAKKPAA
jgi:hypothetical protein